MLSPRFQHQPVNIPMKSMVRKIKELVHSLPVIIHLVASLAVLARVAVRKGQDSRPACVQPVPGFFFTVTCD